MKSVLIAATALFLLASCQKEVEDDLGGGGGVITTPLGTQLLRTVTKSGADSTVNHFTYNSSGKLLSAITSGVAGGAPVDLRVFIIRNSNGIIRQHITKSMDLIAFGIDSIVTNISYDAASSRYSHSTTSISFFGINITDSIVYQYDAGGKLLSQIDYLDDGSGMGYLPAVKTEYSYTGANLISQKLYSYDPSSSTYVLDDTFTFQFDGSTNPLQFANEAPILGMTQFFSANNATKTTLVSDADPSTNFVSDVIYTYNTVNRPLTATETNAGTTSVTTFTYN